MATEHVNIGARYVQRRVLLLSLLLLAILFVVTVVVARSYHAWESGFAEAWIQQGNEDLKAGRGSAAIKDFQNALNYDPENNLVQMRLAEALLAGGRIPEAHAYLLNLWDRMPGSGEVNLELAHISQRSNDVDVAIRYYRGAIYGVWNGQPAVERQKVRLEFCKYLLSMGRVKEAQAEIAGLAAETPASDAAIHAEAGSLFMQAGAPMQAMAEFETATKSEPDNLAWWADAGQTAFEIGNYRKAEIYLSRAFKDHPSAETTNLLETSRDILANDPFQTGLSDLERARRTLRNFRQASSRLQTCLGPSGAQANPSGQLPLTGLPALASEVKNLKKRATLRALRDSGFQHQVMNLIIRIEEATTQQCGKPTGLDRALVLIGKQHESSGQ